MNLKKCSCGKSLTTKNVKFLGSMIFGHRRFLFFNCLSCYSTATLASAVKTSITLLMLFTCLDLNASELKSLRIDALAESKLLAQEACSDKIAHIVELGLIEGGTKLIRFTCEEE